MWGTGAGEISQWVETLDNKPGDLSLIPRTDKVEGEIWLLHTVLWPPHAVLPKEIVFLKIEILVQAY